MGNYSLNGNSDEINYETPFSDITVIRQKEDESESPLTVNQFISDFESPFTQTFEASPKGLTASPLAAEFVQLLSDLEDTEFPNTLYQLSAEIEETWNSRISNEAAMGDRFIPFASQQANEYLGPLSGETERMIERVSEYFSGNNLADHTDTEIEHYFSQLEFDHSFSPAQEQFFGSVFNKIKSVVKTGVDLAKKGVSFVGKFLPINIILDKLKSLIRPLLDKVLKFAIGKLPKNLQPYAQTFANKFLNISGSVSIQSEDSETPTTGSLEAIQTEFDSHIANLVFSPDETNAEETTVSYETSSDNLQRENNYETGGLVVPSLEAARQQFINELKDLKDGENPAPAIERFLPAAILALQPVIKMGLSIIGRQKVINFLAGLLSKLVGKYVPSNVATPLAASIIDVGMSAIGFETSETGLNEVAYESIVNTVQETIQNIGQLSEETLGNNEELTAEILEAFETAAADNFPSQYIREELRTASTPALWILGPRQGPRHYYKKYSNVFNATLTPQISKKLTTFRGLPLANFLRDKLGLNPDQPVRARVHLYEAIEGTKLSQISRFEKVPGLGHNQPNGSVLFHPLTAEAASLLCNEPGLGKDVSLQFTNNRYRTSIGQRFYYLEINGARLRIAVTENRTHRHSNSSLPAVTQLRNNTLSSHPPLAKVASSSDIQGVMNFVRSEIKFNYYFSEEEAKNVVEKLNKNDFIGASLSIKKSVRDVLNQVLIQNISTKVRIIHEAMPEKYLDNYSEQENPFLTLGNAVRGVAFNSGKQLLTSIMEKLSGKLSEAAYQSIVNYFKARASEFKQAQAQPQDGVTIKIIWMNVPGMSAIRTLISAIKGNLQLGSLSSLSIPTIASPEIKIIAGKNFD